MKNPKMQAAANTLSSNTILQNQVVQRWNPSPAIRALLEEFIISRHGGQTVFGTEIDLNPIRLEITNNISFVMAAGAVWYNPSGTFHFVEGVRMDEHIIIMIGSFIHAARGTLVLRRNRMINNDWKARAAATLVAGWNEEIRDRSRVRGGELPLDTPTAYRVLDWWWGRYGATDAVRARASRERRRRVFAEAQQLSRQLTQWAVRHLAPPANVDVEVAANAVQAAREDVVVRAVRARRTRNGAQ